MSEISFLNFAHLPAGNAAAQGAVATGYGAALINRAGVTVRSTNAANSCQISSASLALRVAASSTTTVSGIVFTPAALGWDASTTTSIIGFNCDVISRVTTVSYRIVQVLSTPASNTLVSAALSVTDANFQLLAAGVTSGSAYLELVFSEMSYDSASASWNVGKIDAYRNGLLVYTVTSPGAISEANGIAFSGVTASGTTGSAITLDFSNYYWITERIGDPPIDRLGPIRSTLVNLSSVADSGNWTPTGASTALDALNTTISTTAALQTPYITSGVSGGTLRAKLNASGVVSDSYKAIGFALQSAVAASNGAVPVRYDVKIGEDTATLGTVTPTAETFSGPQPVSANGYISQSAPNGQPWTAANLTAVEIDLVATS